VTGAYEVSGRVATLGAGAIKKKAGRILDEFFGSLERELG
jgi:carbon monoxide dehydrogenase subunit G